MIDLKDKRDIILSSLRDIGTQIHQYREMHHITQIQLAKYAEVPQSSIVRIEQGKNTSTLTLAKLAVAINHSINLDICK